MTENKSRTYDVLIRGYAPRDAGALIWDAWDTRSFPTALRLSTLTASPWAGILVSPSQLRLDSRIALSFLPVLFWGTDKGSMRFSRGAISLCVPLAPYWRVWLARSQEACSRREVRESPVRRVRNACLISQWLAKLAKR